MSNAIVERQKSAPVVQAQIDWATAGEFNADQYAGEAKQAYNQEAAKIMQQWDNQGE